LFGLPMPAKSVFPTPRDVQPSRPVIFENRRFLGFVLR
jgi:hypothetical protein